MGKQKCGEKKGTANDPKHTASSVKHGGQGMYKGKGMEILRLPKSMFNQI